MAQIFEQTTSVLADGDCPSDWGRAELLIFAQDAARRLRAISELANRSSISVTWQNAREIELIARGDRDP